MSPPAITSKWFEQSVDWHQILGSRLAGLDRLELEQLAGTLCKHSRRSVRLNPLHRDKPLPFETEPVPWYGDGRWLTESAIRPGAYLQHSAGDYYIQDAASMLALSACRIQPDEAVCDVCAAPGGKATGLLQQMKHTGYLVANEVIQSRLHTLHTSLERTGLGNYVTTSLDATVLSELLPGNFDCVLVDAPCSGQSMVASDKQSTAAFSLHQILHSAARQQRILQAASKLVKPGGRLVYSTCTFALAENEDVIEHFLSLNSEWQTIEYRDLQPWASPLLTGCYRLWPHRDQCDGAFVATLIRSSGGSTRGDDSATNSPFTGDSYAQSRNQRKESIHKNTAKGLQTWRGKTSQLDFLDIEQSEMADYTIWQSRNRLLAIRNSIPNRLLASIASAPAVAKICSDRIEPEYSSAVSIMPKLEPTRKVELTSQQAVRYISGESVPLADQPSFQGWCRVDWSERQLGWGKALSGQLKNHLPKNLRQPNLLAG